ncbi:hypothetical protein PVNG_05822 [Plasmodium vivax North Korean]|uniref:Uncharacterized protein n=1 Tax=Plasmodium vivax North Korean TaxID=1035514 RepID=A0A0J9TYU4_PLAVI|nr:hypothetical protein PVNG_05822 [Plasmodium vivax North Korean]
MDKCKDKSDNKPCNYRGYWLYYNVMTLTGDQSLVSNFYIPVLLYTTVNGGIFNNYSIMNFEIDKNKFDIKSTLYGFIEIYAEL